jgi:hypothetical protein
MICRHAFCAIRQRPLSKACGGELPALGPEPFGKFGQIGAAFGVSPETSAQENMAQLRRVWSARAEDADHR